MDNMYVGVAGDLTFYLILAKKVCFLTKSYTRGHLDKKNTAMYSVAVV